MTTTEPTTETTVEIGPGKLRGAHANGIYSFKGVPYALSTAGPGRFMAPVKPQVWTGVREALALGEQAPQPDRAIRPANAWIRDTMPTSEHCLFLNLWTPGLDDGRRPVMVWLHGGGYFAGSGGADGLDGGNLALSLDSLGFEEKALVDYRSSIRQPYGMILITGPTGSGKSTTLYSALKEIYSPEINFVTVEDPVEYPLEQIRQTSVNEAVRLDFASGIRSMMRQDPDIILVGEIRDEDTAEMAFRAAMTGHQG